MQVLLKITKVLPTLALFVSLIIWGAPVCSQGTKVTDAFSISSKIERVKSEKSSMARAQYAEELLDSIKRIGRQHITENEITELTDFLKNQGDPARYWVALTLGYIGPHAKSAVPALETAFSQETCIRGSKTSAHVIRTALIKIGVTPPLVKCPIVKNGYSDDVSITLFNSRKVSTFKNVVSGQCIEIIPDEFVLTKIVVTPKQAPIRTYAKDEFRNTLKDVGMVDGFLVVSETGLTYIKGYNCFPAK